jgi:hypothetical protein
MHFMGGDKVTQSHDQGFSKQRWKSYTRKYLRTKEIHHSKQRIKVTGSHRFL